MIRRIVFKGCKETVVLFRRVWGGSRSYLRNGSSTARCGVCSVTGLRPNVVPGQNPTLPRDKRNITEWFHTAAFINEPGQSNSDPIPGNAGRNLVRGPGYTNVNLSLMKNFSIVERLNLQFRAESFTLLNTPHYSNPNGSRNSGSFGSITSAGGLRVMQFAVKLIF